MSRRSLVVVAARGRMRPTDRPADDRRSAPLPSDTPDHEPRPQDPSGTHDPEPPAQFWRRRGYWLLLALAAVVALGLTFVSRLQ